MLKSKVGKSEESPDDFSDFSWHTTVGGWVAVKTKWGKILFFLSIRNQFLFFFFGIAQLGNFSMSCCPSFAFPPSPPIVDRFLCHLALLVCERERERERERESVLRIFCVILRLFPLEKKGGENESFLFFSSDRHA